MFGPTPPLSYFRVTPLCFGNINGVQHGLIQIDYLTLWNKDDGLDIGTTCLTLSAGFGIALNQLFSHPIDNERSAVLISAPTSQTNTYNQNASEYRALQGYTAAHENTFVGNSMAFSFAQPVPFGMHAYFGISRSKHATYPLNPDNLPILPDWLIASIYLGIASACALNPSLCPALLYIADVVIYTCIIEHHQDPGVTYAGTRINVGELSYPLNNSSFIQDPALTGKLNWYFP